MASQKKSVFYDIKYMVKEVVAIKVWTLFSWIVFNVKLCYKPCPHRVIARNKFSVGKTWGQVLGYKLFAILWQFISRISPGTLLTT